MDTRKIEELTFICTTDGKTPFFKDLTQIKDEDNGNIYGLVSPITHATRDIWSAHAVRLGDEITGHYSTPLYSITWEAEELEDIEPEYYENIQDLHDTYNIINGN